MRQTRFHASGEVKDPFVENRLEIAKANAYLLKRVALCAFMNMMAMTAIGPLFSGFSASTVLYAVSAALTGLFSAFAFTMLDKCLNAVIPLFYALLAGLCGYAIALSSFFYPDIHGVTIIGIFMLVPMIILDHSWRINLILTFYYLVSCACAFARKPLDIAVDDCVTSGAFIVFGMLIGAYLRQTRLQSIVQQRQLEFQRDMDALTRLPNRRRLFETIGTIDNGDAPAALVGILMIDIDNFKIYNDRYGHQSGDECLCALGDLFVKFTEETGITVYRYGGEEFLGLYIKGAACGLDEAARLLVERTRACEMPGESVTISVGYARQIGSVSSERLISMADSALYDAKRRGRNMAVEYMPPVQGELSMSDTLRQRK